MYWISSFHEVYTKNEDQCRVKIKLLYMKFSRDLHNGIAILPCIFHKLQHFQAINFYRFHKPLLNYIVRMLDRMGRLTLFKGDAGGA